jgi:hypothetical protein
MASYTYDQFREVLRSKKHETWEKVTKMEEFSMLGLVTRVKRISPNGFFKKMLDQAGLTEDEFEELMNSPRSKLRVIPS